MKTTKEEFSIFENYFREYQTLFGLNNFNDYFYHKKLKTAYASTIVDCDQYVVSINFATNWDGRPVTGPSLKKCALHECIHLLIAKLNWLGRCRYVGEEEIQNEDESLVVRLTNIINNLEEK